MKWGLLPVSHNALLVGDMAYYNFNGEMEQEADRINLQKCLGPTCKVWLSCSGKMFWGGGEGYQKLMLQVTHVHHMMFKDYT